MVSHICGINIKNYINEVIYKTETDPQISKSNLWLPMGRYGGWGVINQKIGTNIYSLLFIK